MKKWFLLSWSLYFSGVEGNWTINKSSKYIICQIVMSTMEKNKMGTVTYQAAGQGLRGEWFVFIHQVGKKGLTEGMSHVEGAANSVPEAAV